MRAIPAALSAFGASLVPALAAACPSGATAAHACGACGAHSSIAGYVSALGAGILVGLGSVAVERFLRGRFPHGRRGPR